MKKLAITIREEERALVRENIFPAAHSSVEPWEYFQWHTGRNGSCDAHLSHSSQALSIDFFGTLQAIDQTTRDAVVGRIATRVGLPDEGPWQIKLEWRDSNNLLKERTQTQVDAIAESPYSMLFFEAKFSESNGGACRQPLADPKGFVQCDGTYS